MRSFTRFCLPLAALIAIGVTRTAPAAPVPANAPGASDSPLASVPAQCPIVLHLHGAERTKDRLAVLIKAMVPDLVPIATLQLETMFKAGYDGRKLQGLAKDGPVFLAFLELPTGGGEPPAMALIAKVTNYRDFVNGLLKEGERGSLKKESAGYEATAVEGKDVYFIERPGYAVVTPAKEAADLLVKGQPGLDGKIGREVAAKFLEPDLSLYVNLTAVNKEFGDQIKQVRELIETVMDQVPAAGGVDKNSAEMVKKVYGGLFQLIQDGKALVVSFDFRPEGLNLHLQAQVGADTPTDQILKEQKPAALTELGSLPAGMVNYAASQFGPNLLKSMAPYLYGAAGGDDGKKSVDAAINQLVGAGGRSTASCTNFPPEGVTVTFYRDPTQAVAGQLKLFQAMSEGATFQNAPIKGKPEVKEGAESYRAFKFNAVKIRFDLDKVAESVPGAGESMKEGMKKLLGEDLKVWFGTDGKRYLQVTAKDWPTAKGQIDRYLDGQATVSGEPAFQITRKQLPAEATLIGLADAGRFTQAMGDYLLSIFKAVPGLPVNLPDGIKPVTTKTSYLGVALTLQPEHGSFDLFVPVTAVQEIRKVIQPLFKGAQ
jgi:hypothetical protein